MVHAHTHITKVTGKIEPLMCHGRLKEMFDDQRLVAECDSLNLKSLAELAQIATNSVTRTNKVMNIPHQLIYL